MGSIFESPLLVLLDLLYSVSKLLNRSLLQLMRGQLLYPFLYWRLLLRLTCRLIHSFWKSLSNLDIFDLNSRNLSIDMVAENQTNLIIISKYACIRLFQTLKNHIFTQS